MPSDTVSAARKRQRSVFLLGFGAASVPIACQLLVAAVVWSRGSDFPKADPQLLGVGFWCVQIMLLSVAVAGNTIIDFGKHVVDHSAGGLQFVSLFLVLAFFFLLQSILFSVTLLDSELSLTILVPMIIFGLVDLVAAYRVDMEIALAEAGLRG